MRKLCDENPHSDLVAKECQNLWQDFTETTSFKSKSNCAEYFVDRELFCILELDTMKFENDYNFTIQLQMFANQD